MNQSRTPWIVVTSHRPIYTTQMCELGDYVVSRFMREALDSLFEKYQVNLALVAHTHAYERTCLIKGGECVENGGTQHITIGRALDKESVNSTQSVRFGRTSTVRFSPNDRTFFCRTLYIGFFKMATLDILRLAYVSSPK